MLLNPSSFGKFDISKRKVLARLGYAQGRTKIDQETDHLIEEAISAGRKLIVPRQVIASSAVVLQAPKTVLLDPALTIESEKIFELLRECPIAYGFAVTIGPHLEAKRNQYLEAKDTTRALLLDAVGSVTAEELAEITHRQIASEAAARGMAATRRFSPGYGDWELKEQGEFLRWLGANAIGIRLTEQFQMLPEKSVSALLGLVRVAADNDIH